MKHLTAAVQQAMEQKNWYAGLGLALTLPDICGKLEGKPPGRNRYITWCNDYLMPRYSHNIGPEQRKHVFLSGRDCYALRCAVLHEASNDISGQRAREALDSFLFVAPKDGWCIHRNQHNGKLQLQVDLFCADICSGVESWLEQVPSENADAAARLSMLMKIQPLEDRIVF